MIIIIIKGIYICVLDSSDILQMNMNNDSLTIFIQSLDILGGTRT
jgi:hypothetical protein